MHWNLNYITEVWYKNGYTLKDSIILTMIVRYSLMSFHIIYNSSLKIVKLFGFMVFITKLRKKLDQGNFEKLTKW